VYPVFVPYSPSVVFRSYSGDENGHWHDRPGVKKNRPGYFLWRQWFHVCIAPDQSSAASPMKHSTSPQSDKPLLCLSWDSCFFFYHSTYCRLPMYIGLPTSSWAKPIFYILCHFRLY
jgi:hypothetical protein